MKLDYENCNFYKNNNLNISNTLIQLYNSEEGFRNITATSGITKIKDILEFEYNELGNKHIFDFMKNNYFSYKPNNEDIIEYTLRYLSKIFKTNIDNLKGIWVTSYQGVMKYYCYPNIHNDIIKVFIHKNKTIPICDLDLQGVLFVYTGELSFTYDL